MYFFREVEVETERLLLNVKWGERGFIPSKRVCYIPFTLIQQLAEFTTNYFLWIKKYFTEEGVTKESLSRVGCPLHQLGYARYLPILPGLCRIDVGISKNGQVGIYEIQPRPGGMGIYKTFFQNLGSGLDPLTVAFQKLIDQVSLSNGKPPAFLVCEADRGVLPKFPAKQPPYLKELTAFAELFGGEIIFEEDIEKIDPNNYSCVYPRGTFRRDVPSVVDKFRDSGIPFLVPPGYLYHPKGFLSFFNESCFVPTMRIVSQMTAEERARISVMSRKQRGKFVIKPSYGYGAAEVFDCGSFSTTNWQDYISGKADGMVLQDKFLVKETMPELDGCECNFIQRLFFVLNYTGDELPEYVFAGGIWNARARTIRVHGASDAVFGLTKIVGRE